MVRPRERLASAPKRTRADHAQPPKVGVVIQAKHGGRTLDRRGKIIRATASLFVNFGSFDELLGLGSWDQTV